MFKKSPLKSSKLVRKKRRVVFLKIGGSILAVVAFIAGLSWLSQVHYFHIDTVHVEGNSAVDAEEVKSVASSHLGGKYLMLFSRANKYLYQDKNIKVDIFKRFARINSVNLSTQKNTLIVKVTEREPAYTWCSGMPTNSEGRDCYFLDADGYIFSKAPIFSGNAFFAFYGIVMSENPIGSIYLSSQHFRDMDKIIEFLTSKKLHPYAMLAKDNGSFELYLASGGKLIFKKDQDISQLISNLELTVNNSTIFKKHATSTLEYVDLRFGNKVYYKFVGDNVVSE